LKHLNFEWSSFVSKHPEHHMKTKLMLVVVIASLLLNGLGYGYYTLFLNGTAKNQLPGVGGAVRVEATFPDNTFVGVHAGKRRLYKNSDRELMLKSGCTYEVIKTGNRGILGPKKKTLKILP
jgi:hypothetical protein